MNEAKKYRTRGKQFHENDKPDVEIHNIREKIEVNDQPLPKLEQRKFKAG